MGHWVSGAENGKMVVLTAQYKQCLQLWNPPGGVHILTYICPLFVLLSTDTGTEECFLLGIAESSNQTRPNIHMLYHFIYLKLFLCI